MGRACALLPLVAAALVALGGTEARAANAEVTLVDGGYRGEDYTLVTVVVTGKPGERNDVTVGRDGQDVLVRDTGAPLEAGPGCAAEGPQAVRCGDPAPTSPTVRVDLGDGDDHLLRQAEIFVRAGGGEGNDLLEGFGTTSASLDGGAGDDVLIGGDGDDELFGAQGADRLTGGSGRDRLVGDPPLFSGAPDVLDGGDGLDSVSYAERSDDVVVDLTDGFGGAPGPEDRLIGVEQVSGGLGDDVLRGSSAADRLRGGPGGDVVDGRAGDDVLQGDEGVDHVSGDEGDDGIVSEGDGDALLGGSGDDSIAVLRPARQSALRELACGPGDDFLRGLPAQDLLADDCERLQLLNLDTSRPRMVDGHPRLDVARRARGEVPCRLRVELRTFGGRLLARGAKRTGRRDARVTAVLTSTGRAVLRGRQRPVRIEVGFRSASCHGNYRSAGRFRAWL